MLSPYQIKNNFYVLFEAWTSLAACIVRYAQKAKLKKEDWIGSFNLVKSEIIRSLSLLKNETLKREDFLEGDWLVDGGLIYRARTTIVLGALAALEVYLHKTNENYVEDEKLLDSIKNNMRILWCWGESAFPYFFNIIKYLEVSNEKQIAQSLLEALLEAVIKSNSPRSQIGLPNPYYSASDILEIVLGINTERIDFSQFAGSSYMLEPIILMLARRDRREILEKNWRKISHIQFKEFKPDNIEDIFSWRTGEGVNHAEFPKMTQSWRELVKEANDFSGIPDLYLEYLDLLNFFILICPHRINKSIIGILDREILKC